LLLKEKSITIEQYDEIVCSRINFTDETGKTAKDAEACGGGLIPPYYCLQQYLGCATIKTATNVFLRGRSIWTKTRFLLRMPSPQG